MEIDNTNYCRQGNLFQSILNIGRKVLHIRPQLPQIQRIPALTGEHPYMGIDGVHGAFL